VTTLDGVAGEDGSIWRRLFTRLNAHEALADAEGDRQRAVLACWLSVVARSPIRPRIVLRKAPELDDPADPAPPCAVCGDRLWRVYSLVGCTSCLEVFHHACAPPGRPCPRCRES
jgi:hypothetical protein